ncbi:MAG: FprA family A-type flavoprotein, partial [Dehalococcoidia bacterium]|nr:FprA family A-type flavoprotein [Dehalococcoidia bacterium]
QKTALIDTVAHGFEDLLLEKVSRVVDPARLDYLVMNHAEPDHGGSIPRVMEAAPRARLVVNKRGAELASVFYNIPPERCQIVADGDSLDLGGRTLQFLDTPWLHWPETMSTYCPEERVIFSCDFLGAHLASDKLFADEVGDLVLPEAKRYYASIMMPFASKAIRALDRFQALDLRIVAPSHGPVHREPRRLLEAQRKWAGGPLERKVVLIYATMYGSTEALKEAVVGALSAKGVETVEYNLAVADLSHIAADLVDARALVIGSPTFIGGPHPLVLAAMETVRLLRPPGKIAALFGSSGWSGGAAAQLKARLEPAGYHVLEPVEIKGPPRPGDLEAARALGQRVAELVLETSE